jgi:hypothetical protein
VPARKQARILLVDTALAVREMHLVSLRSIPAIVEKLSFYADMYLHEGNDYALVILVPHPHSRETAEVAHFIRHRWSASRILLLESESAVIDDWLYDERVEPHSHSATVCEEAIRLMTDEKYRISPLYRDSLKACPPMSEVSESKDIADPFGPPEAGRVTGEVLNVDDGAHVGQW